MENRPWLAKSLKALIWSIIFIDLIIAYIFFAKGEYLMAGMTTFCVILGAVSITSMEKIEKWLEKNGHKKTGS